MIKDLGNGFKCAETSHGPVLLENIPLEESLNNILIELEEENEERINPSIIDNMKETIKLRNLPVCVYSLVRSSVGCSFGLNTKYNFNLMSFIYTTVHTGIEEPHKDNSSVYDFWFPEIITKFENRWSAKIIFILEDEAYKTYDPTTILCKLNLKVEEGIPTIEVNKYIYCASGEEVHPKFYYNGEWI